ncbi:MAG TPA: flagellar motor switch protein FliN [Thermodesulfobacteriaceae bacterium]|nr:flagellar motor switch protein FliN [Thermodesulfobacteriaceae bacterium]
MLSQEDLDKLLEEETSDTETEDMEDAEDASAHAKQDQKEQADTDADGLDWEAAFAEAAAGGDEAAAKAVSEGSADAAASNPPPPPGQASTPSFNEFTSRTGESSSSDGKPDLNFVLSLPLDLSVELGRSKIQIKELLKLSQGSVIELNKMAGEPAEIFVNQKLMAKGEVVVVHEKFGIKLTEIISPADRVKSLG